MLGRFLQKSLLCALALGLVLSATQLVGQTTPPAQRTPPPPGEVPSIPWSEEEGLCGAPAPILLKSLGSDPKVAIDPPATVTCPLAKALKTWLDQTVQPKAETLLGSPVVKLHSAGSYACRNRYGNPYQPLSEHALANALDIREFVLASGESITVLDDWPKKLFTPPLPLPNPARVAALGAFVPMISAIPADQKSKFVRQVHDDAATRSGLCSGQMPTKLLRTTFISI